MRNKNFVQNNQRFKSIFLLMGIVISLALANLIQYLINPASSWWDFYSEAKWTEVIVTEKDTTAVH